MSRKPETIPIQNRFSPTFNIQQQLDTIQQQNIAYSKYDNYASNGLNLSKTPSHSLRETVNIEGQTIGGSKNNKKKEKVLKPKLCKKTKERIDEDNKICHFKPEDFYYRGKWKNHEIYVDTKDKKRAAKQIFFMFANQMDMERFNYELTNEKNGKKSTVKGKLDKNGKADLIIIKK